MDRMFLLFIKKYLIEDYNIEISLTNLKSVMTQMLNEGYLTQAVINEALNHEGPGENTALHDIVSKIAVFRDSDNYRLFPTTLKITRETKDLLDELKVHPRESYNEVIVRLVNDIYYN